MPRILNKCFFIYEMLRFAYRLNLFHNVVCLIASSAAKLEYGPPPEGVVSQLMIHYYYAGVVLCKSWIGGWRLADI